MSSPQQKLYTSSRQSGYSLKPFFFGGGEESVQSIKNAASDQKIIKKIKPDNLNKDFIYLKDSNYNAISNHQDFMKYAKREQVLNDLPKRKSNSEHISIREMQSFEVQKKQKPFQLLEPNELNKRFTELSKISNVTDKYLHRIKKNFESFQPEDSKVFLKKHSQGSFTVDTTNYWQKTFNKNKLSHNMIINRQMNKSNLNISTPYQNQDSAMNIDHINNAQKFEKICKKMRQIKELSNELKVNEIHALKLLFKEVIDQIIFFKVSDEQKISLILDEYQTKINNEYDQVNKDILICSTIKYISFLSEQIQDEENNNDQKDQNQSENQSFDLPKCRKTLSQQSKRTRASIHQINPNQIQLSQQSNRLRGGSYDISQNTDQQSPMLRQTIARNRVNTGFQVQPNQQLSPLNRDLISQQNQRKKDQMNQILKNDQFLFPKYDEINQIKRQTSQNLSLHNNQSNQSSFMSYINEINQDQTYSEVQNKNEVKKNNNQNDLLKSDLSTPVCLSKSNHLNYQTSHQNMKYHVLSNFIIKGKDLKQFSSHLHQNQISPSPGTPQNFSGYYDNFFMSYSNFKNQNNQITKNDVLESEQTVKSKIRKNRSKDQKTNKLEIKDFSQVEEQALQCMEQVWNDKFGTPSSRNEVLNLAFNTTSNRSIKSKLKQINMNMTQNQFSGRIQKTPIEQQQPSEKEIQIKQISQQKSIK